MTRCRMTLFRRLLNLASPRTGFAFAALALSGLTVMSVPGTPLTATAQAAEVQGIAAIVNDEVISEYDLDQRMRLLVASGSIRPTKENVERLKEQVLRSLVDEKLQGQELARLELKVEQSEIDSALEQIASRSGRTPDEIIALLGNSGVTKEAFIGQITANLAWQKVTARLFAPQVTVSADEVDEILNRLAADADQKQYQLSELVLSFDNAAQEREMTAGAERLVQQLRQGAPFQAVASQFSQSASAARGGDIGWVAETQLSDKALEAIRSTPLGGVTDPIRTTNSIFVYNVRAAQQGTGPNAMKNQFILLRTLFPVPANATNAQYASADAKANRLKAQFKTCKQMADLAPKFGGRVDPPQTALAGQLRDPLRSQLQASEAGTVLGPMRSKAGSELFAICDRKDDQGTNITRESVENSLFSQKTSMVSRRHLRDLRRDAIVDSKK